jgi:glycosyltransferase involved in cell wall biosynthesis
MSLNAPRISVLMPVRNAAVSLQAAVASVQAQTRTDWELLAVDDGSSDGSRELLEQMARDDRRIHLLDTERSGIVGALQTGLNAARGEWIARMDADDLCLPHRFEEQAEWLEQRPEIGLVSCLVSFGGNRASAEGYARYIDWINGLIEPDEICRERFIESPVAHPSVFFRRALVDRFGGYREGPFPEDYELWLRWMDAGVRLAKVPQSLLVWNDPPDRLSRSDPRYAPESFYRLKCQWLGRWLAKASSGRPVFLWGAGKVTRRRFAGLAAAGVSLAGYIDVDERKIGGRADGLPVISVEALPPPANSFVIAGVGSRGAREWIRIALINRGFVEGTDFVCAA